MATRSPHPASRTGALPDLPSDLFDDDFELYPVRPARRRSAPPPAQPARHPQSPARSTGQSRLPAGQSEQRQSPARGQVRERRAVPRHDIVSSPTMRPESATIGVAYQPRYHLPAWHPPVMPQPIQMLEQAMPNLLMAVSALAVLVLGTFTPLGIPVWAAGIFVPSVVLAVSANRVTHLPWKRAALINIATMAIVFPVLVVRQSVVRIPFVDGGNGTLLAPSIATAAVILLLVGLGVACAVLSQEDPEYSGINFLPAAMMVPLMAGQAEITSLSHALLLTVGIFTICALLTILASMLPASYASLVAPATIGLEFVLLTLFRDASIFPTGAGSTAKVLFFVIVVATVALAILVPMLSVWVRQVTRLAQARVEN